MSFSNVHFPMYATLLTSTLVAGAPILYLSFVHTKLSRKIHHTTSRGRLTPSDIDNVGSIPASATTGNCVMVHDTAHKSIPTALLSIDQDLILTQYLRYTMGRFSYFPQAWILRLMSSQSERQTFKHDYIQNLMFKEGDVVCGFYTVVLRTEEKVEYALKPLGPVNGRLVISVEQKGNETVFSSQTVMWKGQHDKIMMPLERSVMKWLHELASWWLLDLGTHYMTSLEKQK